MVLCVSAYYKIPSKQPHGAYIGYLRRFFSFFKDKRLLFFCTKDMYRDFVYLGFDITSVEFIFCEFDDLPLLKVFPYDFWLEQQKLDPELYHTPELGIIWASKKNFLHEAKKLYPTEEWLIWIDAGCVRTDAWLEHANEFTQRFHLAPGIYFQNLKPIRNEQFFRYKKNDYFIAGGLILAHADYIEEYCEVYNTMLEMYNKYKIPAIVDQFIMTSLITTDKYDWIHTINYYELSFKSQCPEEWFFFLQYL